MKTFFSGAFKKLAVNVFLMITAFLLLPIYISFLIIKSSYENYIQRELSNLIVETIKKGEEECYAVFQRMANMSNVFALDQNLCARLHDKNVSYYDRTKRFDELVTNLQTNNLFILNDIKITMFDTEKRAYANWGLMFNDYSFVLDEQWVKDSINAQGHITWSLFAPSFIQHEHEQYISLARSVLYPLFIGERVATLLISIDQREISTMLTRNDIDADFIIVCTENTGEIVFSTDTARTIQNEEIHQLLRGNGKTGSGGRLCVLGKDKKQFLLSYYTLRSPWTINDQRLVVLYLTDYQRITNNLSVLSRAINYRMLVFLIVLAVIIGIISYTVARPIRILEQKINQYTKTRQIGVFDTSRRDEIGDLNRAFKDMEIRINELFDKLRQESDIREQYHFQALRAQINPHFLFNTLNTIRWMATIRKADNIEDTINALSKILDYSMNRTGELAFLKEELEMIRSYVSIQNYRYGKDLVMDIDIEKALEDCQIIKFILQPIVENCFIHAFKKTRRKKIILITGRRDAEYLKLFVHDNGLGITPEKLGELREMLDQHELKDDARVGIINVHRRIRAGYGESFGLSLTSSPGEGTTVEYTLPVLGRG